MSAAYPIFLDVRTMKIVIIGGGRVAKRKALGLVEAGATDVTVVAPVLIDGFPKVHHIAALYAPNHVRGAVLVFAATNDLTVNSRVVLDSQAAGAIVCRADVDDDVPGDFLTPAKFGVGPVKVAVSAGSAALTAAVRDDLQTRFDPRWAQLAAAMTVLRPRLRAEPGLSPADRAAVFRKLATPQALDVLERDGVDGLLDWARARAEVAA